MAEHRCKTPNLTGQITMSRMYPWECGICGRVWTRSNWAWEETRGPSLPDVCPTCSGTEAVPLWIHNPHSGGWTGSHAPCSDAFHDSSLPSREPEVDPE